MPKASKFKNILKIFYYQLSPLLKKKEFKGIEVYIVSHGGVGTTFLAEYISNYKKTNDPYDRDKIKHLPRPPSFVGKDCVILYIYGNPKTAAKSLYRRGYQNLQKYKNGSISPSSLPSTFRSYFDKQNDSLCLTRHLKKWKNSKKIKNKLIFIHYDKIWDHLEDLLLELSIPTTESLTFPKRKVRKTSIVDEDENLTEMYFEYMQIEELLGGFYVKNATTRP